MDPGALQSEHVTANLEVMATNYNPKTRNSDSLFIKILTVDCDRDSTINYLEAEYSPQMRAGADVVMMPGSEM